MGEFMFITWGLGSIWKVDSLVQGPTELSQKWLGSAFCFMIIFTLWDICNETKHLSQIKKKSN